MDSQSAISWARTLLRIGSIRFAAYYLLAYESGVISAGGTSERALWSGLLVWPVLGLGIELVNRYADRSEDAVNRPERTTLCEQVGFATIRLIAIVCFAFEALAFAGWAAARADLRFAVVAAVSWLVAWNYSVGLRLKSRPYGALLALSMTYLLPFAFGWAATTTRPLPAFVLVLPLLKASLGGIKDLTDEAGDRMQGYESRFLILLRRRSSVRLWAVLVAPFALAATLVACGAAPVRYLAMLVLLPGSLGLAALCRAASGPAEAMAVRELMHNYWLVVLATSALILGPGVTAAPGVVVAVVWWMLASRYAHWMPGLSRADFGTLARVARRAGSAGQRPARAPRAA